VLVDPLVLVRVGALFAAELGADEDLAALPLADVLDPDPDAALCLPDLAALAEGLELEFCTFGPEPCPGIATDPGIAFPAWPWSCKGWDGAPG